ncbi:hypothetical protein GHK88_16775, partial [Vibrio cholerae]|nr:hypothetical protein [Vibrio cholerae]
MCWLNCAFGFLLLCFARFSASNPNQQFDLQLRTYSTQPSSDSQTYSVVLGFEDL